MHRHSLSTLGGLCSTLGRKEKRSQPLPSPPSQPSFLCPHHWPPLPWPLHSSQGTSSFLESLPDILPGLRLQLGELSLPLLNFTHPAKAQHQRCLQSSLSPPQLRERVLLEPLWHSYFYFALCVFSALSRMICALSNDKDYDLFTSVPHLPLDLLNSQHCGGNKLSIW